MKLKMPAVPLVTNIGIIDQTDINFNNIPVEDAFVTGAISLEDYFSMGYSTFQKVMTFSIGYQGGEVQVNKNIQIGYLPQESSFKSEHTVLSELTEGNERILRLKKEKSELEEKNQADSHRYGDVLHELESLGFFELEHKAEKVLMGLGFKEKDFNRPISQLSGGWQMRALLGKLLTYQYDILLLDEPTNYLDLNAALWL